MYYIILYYGVFALRVWAIFVFYQKRIDIILLCIIRAIKLLDITIISLYASAHRVSVNNNGIFRFCLNKIIRYLVIVNGSNKKSNQICTD